MDLKRRAEWGARPFTRRLPGILANPTTGHWNGDTILIDGSPTWDHSECDSLVRGVQNFHMDTRRYVDVAYNFHVCPHGYVYEDRGINVVNAANGTNPGNRSSHAVCFLAGIGNPFTQEEKVAFKECVLYISMRTPAPNRAIGHRDHKSTLCPGDERYAWIRAGMPLSDMPSSPTLEEEEMKLWLFKVKETGNVYITDLITKRHVQTEAELDDLVYLNKMKNGQMLWTPETGSAVSDTGSYALVRELSGRRLIDAIPTVTA